jgi:hypothetical protein
MPVKPPPTFYASNTLVGATVFIGWFRSSRPA